MIECQQQTAIMLSIREELTRNGVTITQEYLDILFELLNRPTVKECPWKVIVPTGENSSYNRYFKWKFKANSFISLMHAVKTNKYIYRLERRKEFDA